MAASARSRCTAPSALTGGIPLQVDGEVVGAIGTSGETPDEDEAISIAGAAAEFSVTEVPALTYEGAEPRPRPPAPWRPSAALRRSFPRSMPAAR